MILKYKGHKGFWCYEDLGSYFQVHYGGVHIKPMDKSLTPEEQLDFISKESLDSKIADYLHNELDFSKTEPCRMLTGNVDYFDGGFFNFKVVTNKENVIVLTTEAYIMSDTGKTIEKL